MFAGGLGHLEGTDANKVQGKTLGFPVGSGFGHKGSAFLMPFADNQSECSLTDGELSGIEDAESTPRRIIASARHEARRRGQICPRVVDIDSTSKMLGWTKRPSAVNTLFRFGPESVPKSKKVGFTGQS